MGKIVASEFMLVPEVARYLGINEKKVYFLAKAGKIPCTRVTGKWTFPKKLIDRWVEESAAKLVGQPRHVEERSFILAAGSDDPSLGSLRHLYDARHGSASFFMATVGSSEGMEAVTNGVADVATAHLLEPARLAEVNAAAKNPPPPEAVIVQLFYRELGLVLPAGNPQGIHTIRDLARPKLRIINRQAGSGTRLYFDQALARARVNPTKLAGYDVEVSTHLEVGLAVLRGDASLGVATRTTALLLGLDFLPLTRERFDILVSKKCFFTGRIQSLLSIIGSREFRERVDALGGYDVAESGRIIAPS
jgi:excisionase family DNA binding protein